MRASRFGAAMAWIGFCAVTLLIAGRGHVVHGQQLPAGERPFAGVEVDVPRALRLASGNLFRVAGFFSEISTRRRQDLDQGRPDAVLYCPRQRASLPKPQFNSSRVPTRAGSWFPSISKWTASTPTIPGSSAAGMLYGRVGRSCLRRTPTFPRWVAASSVTATTRARDGRRPNGFLMGYFEDGNLGHWGCEEPAIAELKDGRVLCFMRSQCGRILKSYSGDGGEYWMKVEATDIAMSNSPCVLKRIPRTGDLVMVWNQVSAAEICKGYRRGRLSIAISKNDGQTWGNFKTLELSPGLEDRKRVAPPPLTPMVRGPSGPDHVLGTIPDGFLHFGYPTVWFTADKIVITYLVSPPDGPGGHSQKREFPISWLYEQ